MMTPLIAPPVQDLFLDLGGQLTAIVWVGAIVAVGGCVAILAATLHEFFTERRRSAYSLTFGPAGVRRSVVENFDQAA
jgi:hypothetical protein